MCVINVRKTNGTFIIIPSVRLSIASTLAILCEDENGSTTGVTMSVDFIYLVPIL